MAKSSSQAVRDGVQTPSSSQLERFRSRRLSQKQKTRTNCSSNFFPTYRIYLVAAESSSQAIRDQVQTPSSGQQLFRSSPLRGHSRRNSTIGGGGERDDRWSERLAAPSLTLSSLVNWVRRGDCFERVSLQEPRTGKLVRGKSLESPFAPPPSSTALTRLSQHTTSSG